MPSASAGFWHEANLRSAAAARDGDAPVPGGRGAAPRLVSEAPARIEADDSGLNAFSVVLADQARAEAQAVARRRSVPGPLHGVPIAIKEELDVAGCVTTFGGEANSTPAAADCELVSRLRSAGAVIIGKTTMPEFGAYPLTESDARAASPATPGTGPAPPAARAAVRRRPCPPAWSRSGSAVTAAARSGSRGPAADCSASSRSAAG